MNVQKAVYTALIASLALTGCDDNNSSQANFDNDGLRLTASNLGLTGDPSTGKTLPEPTDALAQLGMKLFFTKGLGGATDTACVSCHHPVLGGGDDLSLSIGVHAENAGLLGPGRTHSQAKAMAAGMHYDGGPTVPRNAPTTFNVAMWEKGLFHDARVEQLAGGIRTPDSAFGTVDPDAIDLVQAQATFPVTSPEEMRADFDNGESNAHLRSALVDRYISQTIPNTWLAEFQSAFDSTDDASTLITYKNISIAIAEYEKSQVFVNSPWKAFLAGDNGAMSTSAKRGAELFYKTAENGGANCVQCHDGDFFTDESFHNIAMPQIGRGKGNGLTGDHDFGRMRETNNNADQFAFRTPSLLNVSATGPYGHSGAYQSLEAVVRHHLNPSQAIADFDFTLGHLDQPDIQHDNAQVNTQVALDKLETDQLSGVSKLVNVALTDQQVTDLVSFLNALTDPCVEDRACLSKWIPATDLEDNDSLRLNAENAEGELL